MNAVLTYRGLVDAAAGAVPAARLAPECQARLFTREGLAHLLAHVSPPGASIAAISSADASAAAAAISAPKNSGAT